MEEEILEEEILEEEEPESSQTSRLVMPVPLQQRTGQLKTKAYGLVKIKLEQLQDNARWEDFDNFTEILHLHFNQGKKDIQCAILIERGVKDYYRNHLKDARKFFFSAIEFADMTENSTLFKAKIYTLLANLYRQEKKLGLAEECLQLSKQHFSLVADDEEKAELQYTMGNFLLELLNITSCPPRGIILEAKRCFEKELQIAAQCPNERVKVKKMRYAFLKIAFLLLDCRNKAGRNRNVNLDDVLEARSCLDRIENELWDSIAVGTEVQFNLARSDQFYRLGNYTKALEFAEDALEVIIHLGFNTQKEQAQERVSHLKQLINMHSIAEIPTGEFIHRLNDMTDESHGYSSGVETDD